MDKFYFYIYLQYMLNRKRFRINFNEFPSFQSTVYYIDLLKDLFCNKFYMVVFHFNSKLNNNQNIMQYLIC